MIDYDRALSARVTGIAPSGIRKFFDLLENMDTSDAISLGVGEPDFVTPWHIRDAGVYALEKGFTKYTSNAGLMELRREISKYLSRRFAMHYDPVKQMIVTVGGSEGIDIAVRAIVGQGDEVIVPVPSFVCYGPIVSLAGGVPVFVETKAEDEFRLTADALRAAITPRTKLLVRSGRAEEILAEYGENAGWHDRELLEIRLPDEGAKPETMRSLAEKYSPDEIRVYEPSLNDIFIEYTQEAEEVI